MSKFAHLLANFVKNFVYSYTLGPYMATYLMDKEKYSFLSKFDPVYDVVTERKPIAKFQVKHGPLGVLSDTENNLVVRELVKDQITGDTYSVERCISREENDVIFIPVCSGRIISYRMYRYALHDYFYEFLRSGESVKEDTDKDLYSSFSQCSGLEINSINNITCLGRICPNSILSHVRISVYVVDLKDFDFNSLNESNRSFDFTPHFNRRFSEVAFLNLSDVSEYIRKGKIIDGITMSAFSLMVSVLMQKAPELYQQMIAANKENTPAD